MFDPQAKTPKEPSPTTTTPQNTALSAAMTYGHLLQHGSEYLEAEGVDGQQVKNLASALRLWVKTHGFSMEKLVGEELGGEFDRYLMRFCDLNAERLAARTQRDRQEQVIRWRRIAEALRVKDTLPATFAGALAHALRVSPLTRAQVARDCGVSVKQLEYWTSGRGQPRYDLVSLVPKLESTLELPQGTLLQRLPLARRTRYQRGVEKNDRTTSFTKLRKSQMARTGTFGMPFEGRLAAQWRELLSLKTDTLREGARARNTWRLKPIERVGSRVAPWMVLDGRICTTAGVQWGLISPFLGWLKLPLPEGRAMSAASVDTLAWLAEPSMVIAYARWRMSLSGGRYHNGVDVFLQLAIGYLRRETGFLWLHPELRETVPGMRLVEADEGSQGSASGRVAWEQHCELARKKLREFQQRAKGGKGIQVSRDPTERIAVVLNDEFPLKRLVDFTETLERSAPPTAHRRDYLAWIRDVVMCRLFMSNPLRASQYSVMTYREDGTGNLARTGPGQYRLRFSAEDFKNEKGAAKKPYDVAVDSSVAPWIDRYLAEARPYLVDANETSRFLLPAVRGPRGAKSFLDALGLSQNKGWSADGILARLKELTAVYIPGCPGFGPHSYRHVIATDHLRRHPGDYITVATLLHDELETVLKNYGHLKVEDGLRVLSSGIREASAQLAAQRKAP